MTAEELYRLIGIGSANDDLVAAITNEGVTYSIQEVRREPHENGSATLWLEISEN